MEARFDLRSAEGGVIGAARLFCSLRSSVLLRIRATVVGEHGTLRILNPFLPHFFHRLRVRTSHGSRSESMTREPTYQYQLRAFVRAVRGQGPNLSDAAGATANLQVIDAVYEKAGMKPRGT
jgi:predicted dehydrogenase